MAILKVNYSGDAVWEIKGGYFEGGRGKTYFLHTVAWALRGVGTYRIVTTVIRVAHFSANTHNFSYVRHTSYKLQVSAILEQGGITYISHPCRTLRITYPCLFNPTTGGAAAVPPMVQCLFLAQLGRGKCWRVDFRKTPMLGWVEPS